MGLRVRAHSILCSMQDTPIPYQPAKKTKTKSVSNMGNVAPPCRGNLDVDLPMELRSSANLDGPAVEVVKYRPAAAHLAEMKF